MKHEHIIASILLFFAFAVFLRFAILTSHQLISLAQTREILSEQFVTENILGIPSESSDPADTYVFNNKENMLPEQAYDFSSQFTSSPVLGDSTAVKKIIVDLSKQRVYAYEDEKLALNFLVSTGKWGATPTGTYRIWYKVRSQTMKGGNRALGTYYYLPNVQWVQYFNQGIGFHSTYWHNNFGTPMSHGCINMTTTDAETLYHWATPSMPTGVKIFRSNSDNPGTEVQVVNSWKI
jgi:L,D-transpeptidase catalytic domain